MQAHDPSQREERLELMGFKKSASEQQSHYSCSKCGEKFIKDKEIYMQKKDDGSWFSCHSLECFKSQGGTVEEKKSFGGGGGKFTSSKFPITDAPKVFDMAETLLEAFKIKRGAHHSASNNKLTIEQELQAIESFFKTLSGGFKP